MDKLTGVVPIDFGNPGFRFHYLPPVVSLCSSYMPFLSVCKTVWFAFRHRNRLCTMGRGTIWGRVITYSVTSMKSTRLQNRLYSGQQCLQQQRQVSREEGKKSEKKNPGITLQGPVLHWIPPSLYICTTQLCGKLSTLKSRPAFHPPTLNLCITTISSYILFRIR